MGLFKKKAPQSSEEKKAERIIRLCPRCMKPMPRPAFNVSGWFAPNDFICHHCGYTGHFFIEVDANEVDLQKLDNIAEGRQPPDEFEPEDGEKGEEEE